MDKYAEGKVIETATGYIVSIGEPLDYNGVAVDGDVFVCDGPSRIEPNTQYLVTLEVDGEAEMYRELWTSGDYDENNNVPLGDHTYVMDEAGIYDVPEGDHVRVRFEPVEVLTTDAFRAAVKSLGGAASDSSGGGSGGVLVVHLTWNDNSAVLDKTWQEIKDADSVSAINDADENARRFLFCVCVFERKPLGGGSTQYIVRIREFGENIIMDFIANSASGYPSYSSD